MTTGELEKEDNTELCFKKATDLLNLLKAKGVTLVPVIYPKFDHMDTAIPTFEKGLELISPKNR